MHLYSLYRGNLGRAGYGASTEGTWPYTYDSCDVGTYPNQQYKNGTPPSSQTLRKPGTLSTLPGQKLSSCSCPGSDHPGPAVTDGRGVPEIDVYVLHPFFKYRANEDQPDIVLKHKLTCQAGKAKHRNPCKWPRSMHSTSSTTPQLYCTIPPARALTRTRVGRTNRPCQFYRTCQTRRIVVTNTQRMGSSSGEIKTTGRIRMLLGM